MRDERSETTKETLENGVAILNIAAGKVRPLDLDRVGKDFFLVNVDKIYAHGYEISKVEQFHEAWLSIHRYTNVDCCADIFEFLQRYSKKFDRVVVYRFMEHIRRSDLAYFIYLLATVLKIGGSIDCIIPNYQVLARMLLNEDVSHSNWEALDILLTSEIVNEPDDAHASIWTPERAIHYFELENRFRVSNIEPNFYFDGRDIYMRVLATRVEPLEMMKSDNTSHEFLLRFKNALSVHLPLFANCEPSDIYLKKVIKPGVIYQIAITKTRAHIGVWFIHDDKDINIRRYQVLKSKANIINESFGVLNWREGGVKERGLTYDCKIGGSSDSNKWDLMIEDLIQKFLPFYRVLNPTIMEIP